MYDVDPCPFTHWDDDNLKAMISGCERLLEQPEYYQLEENEISRICMNLAKANAETVRRLWRCMANRESIARLVRMGQMYFPIVGLDYTLSARCGGIDHHAV